MADAELGKSKEFPATKRLGQCVIFDRDQKLLLAYQHAKDLIVLDLPGAQANSNERPSDAAKRGIKERFNIEVKVSDYLGSCGTNEDGIICDNIWFAAKIVSSNPQADEISYWSWEELQNQPESFLSPNVKNLLAAYTSGKLNLEGL